MQQFGGLDSSDSEVDIPISQKRGKTKQLKSGLEEKVTDEVKFPQKWPHVQIQHDYARAALEFRSLNMRLFTVGELETITSDRTPEREKEGRIRLLKQILYHAGSYEWSALLDLHTAVVRKIEVGERDWGSDFTDIEHMTLTMRPSTLLNSKSKASNNRGYRSGSQMGYYNTYNQGYSSGGQSRWGVSQRRDFHNGHAHNGQDNRVFFCSLYQTNECQFNQSHVTNWKGDPGNRVLLQHICATCWQGKGVKANHPEIAPNCPFKQAQ